jgi:hypothetical protein
MRIRNTVFDCNADPNPALHSNADPDPSSKTSQKLSFVFSYNFPTGLPGPVSESSTGVAHRGPQE